MRVTGRIAARAVFDEHALHALAGNVRQLVLVDEGHLGILLLRLICQSATERQGGDKQRIEDAFHGTIRRFGGCGSGFCLRRAAEPFVETDAAAPVSGLGSRTTSRGSPAAFK